jgi:leucyl/phenylalanyl-tRNA---protein transferase
VDVAHAIGLYASGLFPMDAEEHAHRELPWWTADPRTVLELDEEALAMLRRKVWRSLRAGEAWFLRRGTAFEEVLRACARPRGPDDGVWISPRLAQLYRGLHAAGHATSWEVWTEEEELAAGLVAIHVGRAAMLESMFHRIPHAGNVLLARVTAELARLGVRVCDVQLPTDHLRRLGARDIPRAEYEARLWVATGLRDAGA